MSIQLHITTLCAPRAGFTAQPGPAGLAGLLGASRGGRGGHGVARMGFGPGCEAVLDGASSHVLGGNDSSFTSDRSSYAGLDFDYKSFDYNRIHYPWRSCFA